MNNFLLARGSRLTIAVLAAVFFMGGAVTAQAAEPKLDDNWHFTILLPLWLPSINGTMNINAPNGAQSDDFLMGSDNYVNNFEFAAMLTLEVEKGNWSFLVDGLYASFSDDNRQVTFPRLPGGRVDIKADTSFDGIVVEGGLGYAFARTEEIRADFLVGVRYLNLETKATTNSTASLPGGTFSSSGNIKYTDDFIDPIVAFKGKFELGKGWFLPYYLDCGGFGINNEWSWQAFAAVGYHFVDLFSMFLGYRHLEYQSDHAKLLQKVYLTGPELGFVFRF